MEIELENYQRSLWFSE